MYFFYTLYDHSIMKKIEDIRRDNTRRLAKEVGGTTVFAEKIDRSASQVSRFIGPNPRVQIGTRLARHIEQCMGYPDGWLDQDRSEDVNSSIINTVDAQQVQLERRVPIISDIQAGAWTDTLTYEELGNDLEWIDVPRGTSSDAFALRVSGNSMTNPFGSPSLPNGSIVVIEPNPAPPSGKIVAATLNDSPQATIKKLEIDGPNKFLVPLNPKYDPIPINGNCRIIGYVKRVIMDL